MMKKLFILGCTILLLLFFSGCGKSSIVNENNAAFGEAVMAANTDELTLNDITTFEWDTMYTFTPNTPKKSIEEIIGFSSSDIKVTINESIIQMIFVKDKKVVCSIWGYGDNLGYFISFGKYDGDYLVIDNNENAIFTVDNSGEKVVLTYNK